MHFYYLSTGLEDFSGIRIPQLRYIFFITFVYW